MIELCNMAYIKKISAQKDWIYINLDSEFKTNMILIELTTH